MFAKALSCAISVLNADHAQDGAATSHVRREISVFVATEGPFWFVTFLFECKFYGQGECTKFFLRKI